MRLVLLLIVLASACATPRTVPPGARLHPAAVENLDNAALAYSWSGPIKWGTIGLGAASGAAFYAGEEELGAGLLIAAGISVAIALALDENAGELYAATMLEEAAPPPAVPARAAPAPEPADEQEAEDEFAD